MQERELVASPPSQLRGGGERGEVSFIFGVTRLNLRERQEKREKGGKKEKKEKKERKKREDLTPHRSCFEKKYKGEVSSSENRL